MMGIVWDINVERPEFPQLTTNLEADLVVVGLGGSGLTALLHAAQRCLNVIGIDADPKANFDIFDHFDKDFAASSIDKKEKNSNSNPINDFVLKSCNSRKFTRIFNIYSIFITRPMYYMNFFIISLNL
jgi:D-arabinose 1-dehydrogenase-like Zn-dependent alcohol dehydrogenase